MFQDSILVPSSRVKVPKENDILDMLNSECETNMVSQNVTSKLSHDSAEHPVEQRSNHQEMMKM
jgi:hypothetical protein